MMKGCEATVGRIAQARNRIRRWLPALGCFTACLLPGASALAQQDGRVSDEGSTLLQLAIAAGILVVTAVAAFINPKRTHLD
jgi:hypothetical protein